MLELIGTNFDLEELVKGINYAKVRNVKTNFTLNILIKNDEFKEAMELVDFVYKAGIDAVIIQDLGLAKKIIETYPDLEVHASTQMTIYDLDGVKELEELGFSRVVLARELDIKEIENICKNTKTEIEVFVHGALCISYSGQCLASSIIGGRSANRGTCAGTCRLPYELINKEKSQTLEKGYLLSSKDVCTLDILPELINSGVKSFKIEGRMKSAEYVAIVTAIYRKYIDRALNKKGNVGADASVDPKDKQKLMQVFNRGGFSTGYLKGKLGKEMIYTNKPNHLGIYIGKVIKYGENKGHVKFNPTEEIVLGDSISIRDSSCKISELMENDRNIKLAKAGQIITIGRIKGNIKAGDSIYKTVSINLRRDIEQSYVKENIKRDINCKITLKENKKMELEIEDETSKIKVKSISQTIPEKAHNTGITKERIIEQLSKTGNTIFKVNNVDIDISENIIVPISSINELRRIALEELEIKITDSFKRESKNVGVDASVDSQTKDKNVGADASVDPQISILLNELNNNINYASIKDIDNVYLPFKLFLNKEFKNTIKNICEKFNTFIYLPTITKGIYSKLLNDNLEEILKKNLKGIVVSNISQLKMLEKYKTIQKIANYTMNVSNNETVKHLEILGLKKIILSPEFDKNNLENINGKLQKELMVYRKNSSYDI